MILSKSPFPNFGQKTDNAIIRLAAQAAIEE